MLNKFFDKKASGSGIKNENMSDQQFTEELHEPIILQNSRKEKYTQLL